MIIDIKNIFNFMHISINSSQINKNDMMINIAISNLKPLLSVTFPVVLFVWFVVLLPLGGVVIDPLHEVHLLVDVLQ